MLRYEYNRGLIVLRVGFVIKAQSAAELSSFFDFDGGKCIVARAVVTSAFGGIYFEVSTVFLMGCSELEMPRIDGTF